LSARHFALNKDDEFTLTHPIAFSLLGEKMAVGELILIFIVISRTLAFIYATSLQSTTVHCRELVSEKRQKF